MQVESQLDNIYSIVPIREVRPQYSLQKKHWHIIASAEYLIPKLTYSLKITQVLLIWDMKLYLSVEIVVIPMVGPSQQKLQSDQIQKIEGYKPIERYEQLLAIGSGLHELPVCARCFLGYSCKKHIKS